LYRFLKRVLVSLLRTFRSPFYIFEKRAFFLFSFLYLYDASMVFFLCSYLIQLGLQTTKLEGAFYLLCFLFFLWFYCRIRHRKKPKFYNLQKNYLLTFNTLYNFDINRIKHNFEDNVFYAMHTLIYDVKCVYKVLIFNPFFFFVRYNSNSYSKLNKKFKHYSDIIKKYK